MKLFSKVNEYNSLLEEILETKYFSSNVKNLILNMVYKLENSYNDYYKVKRIRKSKEDFLLELIKIIRDYADNIKLVDPNKENSELLKEHGVLALTNEKERSILSYRTEKALLYGLSDVVPKYFYINNSFIFKNGFQKMLVYGYNKNNLELITDFNGWSWDITKNDVNYTYNLIYQNLILMMGSVFLDQWMNYNSSKIDFIKNIRIVAQGTNFYYWLCRIIYLIEKNNEYLENCINDKCKKLREMTNEEKYFEKIKEDKLKLLKAVERIDQILNNEKIFLREFKIKNSKLPENKKILNLKTYKLILIRDRERFSEKIQELSQILIPKNYLIKKEELEIYYDIKHESKKLEESIIELQKEFIKVLIKKVEKENINDEIIDIIYKLRYYENIYINNEKRIKDIEELSELIEKLKYRLIKKACDTAVLRIFSMNIKLNYKIIKEILDSKIIDLEEIKVKLNYDDKKIKIEVYDKEVFDKEIVIEGSVNKKDLEIKKNKLVNLFI